ncbi:cytotoxic translational repressor of toxin-antitoxin stability system [Geitlerinema sp. PCC 9228]|uniref:cytotoxic translational repressor of toxin-antitoxin stability system n=1 Tax=Geitlerinema sp. PCC 9228 TaxID=111611 RepID=UPI001FCDA86D|nr:cytotoxic translational repressor of toxin-antitoxin stability system [Geitlerinema sp. PCC 9228]
MRTTRFLFVSVTLEIRYTRSFLLDLFAIRQQDETTYKQLVSVLFVKLPKRDRLRGLPQLRQIDTNGMFYRFTLDGYVVGTEMVGEIVKLVRILPKPPSEKLYGESSETLHNR